jgi:hypothetical protein
MSVLNEMISEIKFIKFLANEDRWTKRALDKRAVELSLIRQSKHSHDSKKLRYLSIFFFFFWWEFIHILGGYLDIMFSFVWSACPIGVSILSFWAYIANGHRLTVSTAFTAVQLFSMLAK